MEHQTNKQW